MGQENCFQGVFISPFYLLYLGFRLFLYSLFQGKTVLVNGQEILPEQVLKAPIRGHRIAIMGDTYDATSLESLVHALHQQGKISDITLDVLVHEATLENSMFEDAQQKGHSVPRAVAELAARLNVQLLILTHFSHRYGPITEKDADKFTTDPNRSNGKDLP